MAGIVLMLGLVISWITYASTMKNVLLIMADDMRPEIYAYENRQHSYYPKMKTPNLDALASRSLVLKNAYAQIASCGPSRVSLLTGRTPNTTRVFDYSRYWRESTGDFITLPQYFKNNGYHTTGHGKVFHPGTTSGDDDDSISWTEPVSRGGSANHESTEKSWQAIEDNELEDQPLIDQVVADQAIARLETVANKALTGEKPFFIAAGFYKPHLPFVFPKSILDLYPEATLDTPTNKYVPMNMPQIAWQNNYEVRKYNDMVDQSGNFNTTFMEDDMRALRRAYVASVTWVDSQIGRVLNKLEDLGLKNETIVVFISDHGYLLGEHGQFAKTSNFEQALRTPMMIHIPKLTDCGIETETITELVDLFPTIVNSAGLHPIAKCGDDSVVTLLCTEGTSLLPLIASPREPIKTAAFSQTSKKYWNKMGYTIRTKKYRYTEWREFDFVTNTANWETESIQRELYNHDLDWDENFNIANDESQSHTTVCLSEQLRKGWRNYSVNETCE